jgi:D-arabinose 1-dehydrogenase-like Zn-dependent alcohol dehydrogenase
MLHSLRPSRVTVRPRTRTVRVSHNAVVLDGCTRLKRPRADAHARGSWCSTDDVFEPRSVIDGLKPRGKLLIVAAPFTPMPINTLVMLSGKSIAGWPSGSSIDSEDTVAFSALTGVRARVEKFALADAEKAFAHMMENKVRFRAVLVP